MTIEHDEFLQIVSMSAKSARAFANRTDDPVDLGPADEKRYREGARVYGFRVDLPTCECATCVRNRKRVDIIANLRSRWLLATTATAEHNGRYMFGYSRAVDTALMLAVDEPITDDVLEAMRAEAAAAGFTRCWVYGPTWNVSRYIPETLARFVRIDDAGNPVT